MLAASMLQPELELVSSCRHCPPFLRFAPLQAVPSIC